MKKKRNDRPLDESAPQPQTDVEKALEEEQQGIELPAREAFSIVFSSPTFLHASGVAEQVLPDDPATDVPA